MEKKKTAAYCRVSTLDDAQDGSFETQREYFEKRIKDDPTMEFVGIYGDHGKSGRSIEGRNELNRLIKDCEAGKVQRILTKSIGRFARNMAECVEIIRHLSDLGISVYFEQEGLDLQTLGVRLIFEKEDIDTDTGYSEMMMTILAAFAEEESRSLSENSKWGMRKRAQAGEKRLVRLYGYRKAGDNYEIVPEEAELVRFVFDQYERGDSTGEIAKALTEMGAPRLQTQQDWDDTRIRRMIINEKYAGDYKTQKYYHKDVLDPKKRAENWNEHIHDHPDQSEIAKNGSTMAEN